MAPHIRSHRAPCSCFPKKASLQLSSEQSVGDVRIIQLDWKRVPPARSGGCKRPAYQDRSEDGTNSCPSLRCRTVSIQQRWSLTTRVASARVRFAAAQSPWRLSSHLILGLLLVRCQITTADMKLLGSLRRHVQEMFQCIHCVSRKDHELFSSELCNRCHAIVPKTEKSHLFTEHLHTSVTSAVKWCYYGLFGTPIEQWVNCLCVCVSGQ